MFDCLQRGDVHFCDRSWYSRPWREAGRGREGRRHGLRGVRASPAHAENDANRSQLEDNTLNRQPRMTGEFVAQRRLTWTSARALGVESVGGKPRDGRLASGQVGGEVG